MKKRLLITMTALMLVTVTMMAVPAKPGLKKKVTLKDGTTVELSLRGDEHFSFYTDANNQPCLLNDGKLKMLTNEEVSEMWTANKKQRIEKAGQEMLRRAARRAGKPSSTNTGTQRGLVILVEFKDVKFVTENPQPTFQRFFNEVGYNEDGMAGSVKDYFKKQSYNQLTIDFDVVGPFTTANDMEYYGAHYTDDSGNDQNDIHPVLMVREAVDAAHEAGVDFSKYDWDKDGNVDQVFVIYAGYSEAQGGAKESIWPHEWSLSAESKRVKYDGVWINTYGCAAELRGNDNPDSPSYNPDKAKDGIGTACHEFSHCLGLPDMYDTDYSGGYGTGSWDVMNGGSYLDNSRTPAGYTSYERWFSGWMEPIEIKEMTQITGMKPLATHAEAYVLYNEGRKKDITGEYYLLENRQPVDFDSKLYGHGMLILHVDYNESAWTSNKVNDDVNHQRCTIIPADNQFAQIYYNDIAGDPWPGVTGNTLLNNYSTPAATVFSKNSDGQKFMNKQIDSITENPTEVSNVNTISFVACRPEIPAPASDEATEQVVGNSVTISWPQVEGAIGYEIEWTINDKAPQTPEDALQREISFDKCYSEKTGTSDISSKLSNYGLSGWSGTKLYTSPNNLLFGTSKSNGSLKSPTWKVPSSANMTIVMGANKKSDDVPGTLSISYRNQGDAVSSVGYQSVEFTVAADGKQVFNFSDVRKGLFWLEIHPEAQMYLNYLAIYDGIWTAEQLGIGTASQVSRRASTTDIYPTTTNSITMPVDNNKVYIYRIRSLSEGGSFSAWSNEKTFDPETTGIQSISTKVNTDNTVRYFDLQGREVNGATKGLLIRKQGNNVTKVMVK